MSKMNKDGLIGGSLVTAAQILEVAKNKKLAALKPKTKKKKPKPEAVPVID